MSTDARSVEDKLAELRALDARLDAVDLLRDDSPEVEALVQRLPKVLKDILENHEPQALEVIRRDGNLFRRVATDLPKACGMCSASEECPSP